MKRIIYILLIPVVLSSCITAKITSTKDPSHTDKVDNILIVMRGVDLADKYLIELKRLMGQSFNERGVKSNIHILESQSSSKQELSLDTEQDITTKINKEIAAQLTKYSPNYLMTINQTHVKEIYGNINNQEGGTFDVKLFKSGQDKMIWRAKLEMFSNQGFKNGAKLSNQRIFERLAADGLVKSM